MKTEEEEIEAELKKIKERLAKKPPMNYTGGDDNDAAFENEDPEEEELNLDVEDELDLLDDEDAAEAAAAAADEELREKIRRSRDYRIMFVLHLIKMQ